MMLANSAHRSLKGGLVARALQDVDSAQRSWILSSDGDSEAPQASPPVCKVMLFLGYEPV